ncbi:MAG: F0F1 ATP synthase subunit A [Holosporaceae bacterium]|jgi:F-type H+-transporting ATPase subunit a|nr:F0F1 ATP synthase subunit A [Holosporaceae bacterium]
MLDPLHQFAIKPVFKEHSFSLFGFDLSFTNSSVAVLVTVLAVYVILTLGTRNKKLVPDRLQAVGELAYKLVADMIDSNVGRHGQKYFPFVFSIFLFILTGNLLGMVPGMFTFTSHIIATFALATLVFLFVTVIGFARHGMKFFGIFAPQGLPKALLIPLIIVELISYLSRPFSLAVRLFANMMAGHTMMKVFAGFVGMLGLFWGIAPMAVNVILTGFEIVVSVLQAYIFTILTCVYLHDAVHLH